MLGKLLKQKLRQTLRRFDLDLVRAGTVPIYTDIGRNYRDDASASPRFSLQPLHGVSGAPEATRFTIQSDKGKIEETIFYSHLTLVKMIKDFQFDTVLDIGSHIGNCARVFEHCGKQVIRVEIAPVYIADYRQNYLDVRLPEKVDAIWCSQTLEHQRNVGAFLNKAFDDLKDNGVLAITVPFQANSHLDFGHCNLFSPLILIYHLVCAGFDCSQISLKCYNGNIGAILRKRSNGINRNLPQGTLPDLPSLNDLVQIEDRRTTMREVLGEEIFAGMAQSFPVQVISDSIQWQHQSINWGNPI